MSRTVGQLLTTCLADLGVNQVFGVVGDALNAFTDAIREDGRISWMGVRHEEGAALAASGQAKLTGRLAVCAGTTGPGASHLLAGLYEAAHDHAPVLAIGGDVPTNMGGIDYFQWADHVQAMRDACVYATAINSPDAAAGQIREAIAAAYGKRGVALINVPQNIFQGRTGGKVTSLSTLRPLPGFAPTAADLDAAAALIEDGQKITLLVGHGAREAKAEVLDLADRLRAPIVHTFRALDLFKFDDPRVVGGVGLIGSNAGYEAVQHCDVLVMIGTDYPYSEFLPKKAKVVQIDDRSFAIGRRVAVDQAVVGAAKPALAGLLERLAPRDADRFLTDVQKTWSGWQKMLAERSDAGRKGETLHPQALVRAVGDVATNDAVFVVDTGMVVLWTANWLMPTGEQRVLASFNNGAVGTALGMANGVQALDRSRQVVAMCGDGGFAMLMQEFMTAVQHDLPLKCVIFNNGGWDMVHLEMERDAAPAFGVEFRNPDFAKFADACGGKGFTVETPDALEATLREAFSHAGPVVIDVKVVAGELPLVPHIDPKVVWKFGIGKARELLAR